MSRRLIRLAAKLAQLTAKIILIRCFGIDGAACVLAGVVATHGRLRAVTPVVMRRISDALCRARSLIARVAGGTREQNNKSAGQTA